MTDQVRVATTDQVQVGMTGVVRAATTDQVQVGMTGVVRAATTGQVQVGMTGVVQAAMTDQERAAMTGPVRARGRGPALWCLDPPAPKPAWRKATGRSRLRSASQRVQQTP
jgi:hypothetical protein